MNNKYKTTKAIMSLSLALTTSLIAQDPFSGKDNSVKTVTTSLNKGLNKKTTEQTTFKIVYEIFSLPITKAATFVRNTDSSIKQYNRLIETGQLEETVAILCLPGNTAKTKSVIEKIYATEYEPSTATINLPPNNPPISKVGKSVCTGPGHRSTTNNFTSSKSSNLESLHKYLAHTQPITFDTREVGLSVETQLVVIRGNTNIYELSLNANLTRDKGMSTQGEGISKTTMPIFETRSNKAVINVTPGIPSLIGTFKEPSTSKQVKSNEKRIWISYVTVIPVRK